MPTCRICQHSFATLKFQTQHIGICTRCVNTLNESPEPAVNAEQRLAEKLARGMLRNAERDLQSVEQWKHQKAQRVQANLDGEVAAALHDWITRLLENPRNSTRDFKLMRAHRRGLLRMEGFAPYPNNWIDVARKIRHRDEYQCKVCGGTGVTLDVHHIVYLSHHGTNQQSNLITLCRRCHEAEHERKFDWPEAQDPDSATPIQPTRGLAPPSQLPQSPSLPAAQSPTVLSEKNSETHTELRCPQCNTELTIPTEHARTGQKLRCVRCSLVFLFGSDVHKSPPINATASLDEKPIDLSQQHQQKCQTPTIESQDREPQVIEYPALPPLQISPHKETTAALHPAVVVIAVVVAIALLTIVLIASR